MSILKFFYNKLLRREYPLVCITRNPTYNVPYCHAIPETVVLSFSPDKMKYYGVTEDNIDEAMAEILVHEYLHIVLWRIHRKAGTILNDVNGWNQKYMKLTWKLWKTKDRKDGYVWETVDGETG